MGTRIPLEAGLYLNNTLSRKKEKFSGRDNKNVKIFTCGPSLYKRPHIGNFRTFLFEDILKRYLEYLGYRVKRVINFTDLEDKAIEEAMEQGISLNALAQKNEEIFVSEARLLKIDLPEIVPRSSDSFDQSVLLIKGLLEKGYAYWHENDIFYDPLKFKGFGKLFGLDMSKWPKGKKRFRKDTYPGQRWNLGDFILWFGCKEDQEGVVCLESEIGKGRPSWNIQDPAIISKYLGYQIDICCGGVDNLYRHHDYTIAIIEAFSGKELSRYWLHGEHLIYDGEKMSKSKGNIIYTEDVLKKGFTASDLRFFLTYEHYRNKLNFNFEKLEETRKKLESLRNMVKEIAKLDTEVEKSHDVVERHILDLIKAFEHRMNDDFDVKGAFDGVYNKLAELRNLKIKNKIDDDDAERIISIIGKMDTVLQVIL